MNHTTFKKTCLCAHDELCALVADYSFVRAEDFAYDIFIRMTALLYAESSGALVPGPFVGQWISQLPYLGRCFLLTDDREASLMEELAPALEPIYATLKKQFDRQCARGDVRIVGWMHQYFLTRAKQSVFSDYRFGRKATGDDIAFVTQLFTPDWIVSYLVENSLGRLWLETHEDSPLASRMKYYTHSQVDDALKRCEGTAPEKPGSAVTLGIRTCQSISVVDPACGAGHILVYAFDLLVQMYQEMGYDNARIPQMIFKYNLTGLEIDQRVASVARFSLVMKACEVYPNFLQEEILGVDDPCVPHIVCLKSIELTPEEQEEMGFCKEFLDAQAHMGECGSLYVSNADEVALLEQKLSAAVPSQSLHAKLAQMKRNCQVLAATYDVVVTNPPYMGSANMDAWLLGFLKRSYGDTARDLCAAFMERGFTLAPAGYVSMVTMHSWMFIFSYQRMRERLLHNRSMVTMAHLGSKAFGSIAGEVVQTTACVYSSRHVDAPGYYVRLVEFEGEKLKEQKFLAALRRVYCPWRFEAEPELFERIPGYALAYWVPQSLIDAAERSVPLREVSRPRQGLATGDNDRFLRYWHEISLKTMNKTCQNMDQAFQSGAHWFPCSKGGLFRRWYGNHEFVMAFDKESFDILKEQGNHVPGRPYYFRAGLTWGMIGTRAFSVRMLPEGFMFTNAGLACFPETADERMFLLGMLNSRVSQVVLDCLAPTINYSNGDIGKIPVLPLSDVRRAQIMHVVDDAMALSREDWDLGETSWDFKRSPLL